MRAIISCMRNRAARNHVIYMIRLNEQTYIGVSAINGRTTKKNITQALTRRWERHVYHALVEKRGAARGTNDTLQEHIRKLAAAYYPSKPSAPELRKLVTMEVMEIVRGKAKTHEREKELIKMLNPSLNIECTEKKHTRACSIQ